MPELLGLPYSPWTEKARWALDARKVEYRFRVYAPLVGEPALRYKLKRWRGIVSVPVLTMDDGRTLSDSLDIARWGEIRGEGPSLFPSQHDAAIGRFVALSERGLSAGRGLSLLRMLEDREALTEMVPRALRRPLGPVAVQLSSMGVRRTLRKYGADGVEVAELERRFVGVLEELRRALASGAETLLGQLTFADIAMAQVLAFVAPPAFGLRLGRASRRAFTDDALCARYADLVRWRDRLYELHRPRPEA